MPKLNRKTLLGIKSEASQNAGAALAVTDFLWVADATIDVKAEVLSRDYSRQYLEPVPHLVGKQSAEIKFKTELKGSGLATTLVDTPFLAALYACGLSATPIVASISAFRTSSDVVTGFYGPGKSAYIDLYKDGIKHGVSGAIGTFKIALEASKIPYIEFTFSGLYTDPVDATMPAATPNVSNAALVEDAGIGILNYVNPVASKFEIDLGAKVVERPDVTADNGLTGFLITEYAPKGSFDPEAVTVATKNFMNQLMAGTTGTLSATIGTAGGTKVTVSAACVAYSDVKYGNRNDILTYSIPFNLYSYAGGDGLTIKFQ